MINDQALEISDVEISDVEMSLEEEWELAANEKLPIVSDLDMLRDVFGSDLGTDTEQ